MKPICVKCERFMRLKKSGVGFIEGMPAWGPRLPPAGRAGEGMWRPYKLWMGDRWHCPDCSSEVIVGCGLQPISEHYMADFQREVDSWCGKDPLMVKDC